MDVIRAGIINASLAGRRFCDIKGSDRVKLIIPHVWIVLIAENVRERLKNT